MGKHDPQLIREALMPDTIDKVKKETLVALLPELEQAKERFDDALAAATKKKGKKAKGKGPKKPSRALTEIYYELVELGIVKKCPKVHLTDLTGDYNYLGKAMEIAKEMDENVECVPSPAETRQLILEYCILPLGGEEVMTRLYKGASRHAVLLYGPAGTGKTLLAHAIAHETAAYFFNLSPMNIARKYPGKATQMVENVFEVAKGRPPELNEDGEPIEEVAKHPPAVIYIDEIERIFEASKKKKKGMSAPSGEELPSRITKSFMKLYGKLQTSDRVMVVGCPTKPWECEKNKDFKKMFTKDGGKMLYVPKPDYSSLQMIWKTLIQKRGVKLPQSFDIQTLAHLSTGMTAGKINTIVNDVVTDWRIQKVARGQTLHIGEFIQAMARQREVSKEEVGLFEKFREKFAMKKKKGDGKKKKGGGKKKKK